jgi:hypothetical protein
MNPLALVEAHLAGGRLVEMLPDGGSMSRCTGSMPGSARGCWMR